MDGRLDIDSFEKAITGLNKNLSDVGLLFRANMPLLATDATQETKENCVDKMSDRIAELLENTMFSLIMQMKHFQNTLMSLDKALTAYATFQ